MLAVTTDIALPNAIDKIRIEVTSLGSTQFANDYELGQGKLLIPATLGILQGKDPATPVTLRLIAKKLGVAKMIREVVTTVPPRLATIRIPIRWLCDDSAKETVPGSVESVCPEGQTCI